MENKIKREKLLTCTVVDSEGKILNEIEEWHFTLDVSQNLYVTMKKIMQSFAPAIQLAAQDRDYVINSLQAEPVKNSEYFKFKLIIEINANIKRGDNLE